MLRYASPHFVTRTVRFSASVHRLPYREMRRGSFFDVRAASLCIMKMRKFRAVSVRGRRCVRRSSIFNLPPGRDASASVNTSLGL